MRRALLVLTLCVLLAPQAAFSADAPALTATPPAIHIDALYNGMDLTVTGKAPAGSQVAVRLAGEPGEFHMKQKGKVLGVLWMNLDKVTFAGAPKVFLIAASQGTPEASVAHLGIPGLAERIRVEAFAVNGGTETALGEVDVAASFVGVPAFMANMAFNHGLLFGILASVIAILGGLIIGQLCSGSKGGAH